MAAHLRRKPLEIIPVGQPWMGREDWGRSWKPWLRGTALGFPFGAIPAGGAEIPTFLSYITERRLAEARRRVRQGRHRGRRRARRPPTTPPPPARSCRCSRWALPVTATASIMLAALPELRHPARAAADDRPVGPGVDAARQPADRQHPAAGAQPAAGAAVGEAAPDPAPATCTPASCSSPASAPTPPTRRRSTSSCCWCSACWGWRCAASALPVLPLILGVILGPIMETQAARGADDLRRRPVRPVERAAGGRGLRHHGAAGRGAVVVTRVRPELDTRDRDRGRPRPTMSRRRRWTTDE